MEQDQPHRSPTLFQDPSVFAADYIPEPAPSCTVPTEEQLTFNLQPGMIDATPITSSVGARQAAGRQHACGRSSPR